MARAGIAVVLFLISASLVLFSYHLWTSAAEAHVGGDALAIVVVLSVAILLAALAIYLFAHPHRPPRGEGRTPRSYRHTIPVAIVVVLGLATAGAARWLVVPASFGDFGWYRGDAVSEAKAMPVRHQGEETCLECHDDIAELHDKDAHVRVPCETCHGPGAAHVESEGETAMRIPKEKADCLVCHRLLDARPGPFPQIRWREHYRFVGVKEEKTQCVACHSPHEPLYMDREITEARLHPLIHRCRDCHLGRTDETLQRPESHPAIFECQYCHGALVKDFAARPHQQVKCTRCHIFFKESEFAGRIIRDADPRFCLLCHRDAEFRSEDAAPSIEWPEHRDDMADSDADKTKRCVDCHQDRIHLLQKELTP